MSEMFLFIDKINTVKYKGINRNTNEKEMRTRVFSNAYAYKDTNGIHIEKIPVSYNDLKVIDKIEKTEMRNAIIKVDAEYIISEKTGLGKIKVSDILEVNAQSEDLEKYKNEMTECDLVSELFGKGERELYEIKFKCSDYDIILNIEDCEIDEISPNELLEYAETAFNNIDNLTECVANEMIDKVWDNEDEEVSIEEFVKRVKLLYIIVSTNETYLEFDDGNLFFGHRIHAYFDNEMNFLSADF